MASIDWPWGLASIEAQGYTYRHDTISRRTELEDGAIAQKRFVSRGFHIRRFNVLVKHSKLDDFLDWIETNGNTFFNFRDLRDPTISREVRIRGDAAAVAMVFDSTSERLDGERFWRGGIELEGFWT